MKTINAEQMELGMSGNLAPRLVNQRRMRSARAQWWFAQMRRVVELALPRCQSVPPPVQTRLNLR